MRLLFVHQHFGPFGGAETNIQITADELTRRGHAVALLYSQETERANESWRRTFPVRLELPTKDRAGAVASILGSFEPDIIYLHSLPDIGVIESLLAASRSAERRVGKECRS